MIDLTIPIRQGTPSFPGEPGGYAIPFADLAQQGWVSHQLLLYTHLGTHIDAPQHFLVHGPGVETWSLDQLCGPALVATLRTVPDSAELRYDAFDWPRAPGPGDRVLLHMKWGGHWGRGDYFSGFPSLSSSLADRLVQAGVVLVGMDTPTPHRSEPRLVHEILLKARVVILEGLIHLETLPGPFGDLWCLPLPLEGLDGAPCRVVFCPTEGSA